MSGMRYVRSSRKVQWVKKGGRKLTLPDANKVQKDE